MGNKLKIYRPLIIIVVILVLIFIILSINNLTYAHSLFEKKWEEIDYSAPLTSSFNGSYECNNITIDYNSTNELVITSDIVDDEFVEIASKAGGIFYGINYCKYDHYLFNSIVKLDIAQIESIINSIIRYTKGRKPLWYMYTTEYNDGNTYVCGDLNGMKIMFNMFERKIIFLYE